MLDYPPMIAEGDQETETHILRRNAMKPYIVKHLLPALTVVLVFGILISADAAQKAGLMTKDELQKILANTDTYVLDVRTGRDWNSSEFKIKGAVYSDPGNYSAWVAYGFSVE